MHKHSILLALMLVVALGACGPAAAHAESPADTLQLILNSAPVESLRKLENAATTKEGSAELNRYFGEVALNKTIAIQATVEAAGAHPDPRNAFRIRAASVPLHWEGGTIKRVSYYYFKDADAPAPNSIKAGSQVTVQGLIRRCDVIKTAEGLQMDFDVDAKILSVSPAKSGSH
jgi:hypothetical protein